MLSIAEFGDRTAGRPVIEHPHSPELVAQWIETDAIHIFGAMCDEIGPGCIVPQAPQRTGLPPTAC
jgi:hypothetical protein